MASLQNILDSFESRLAIVEKSLSIVPERETNSSSENEAPFIIAFDAYCSENLEPFIASCNKLGSGATKWGDFVKRGWAAQRGILILASKCKRPENQAELLSQLKPVQEIMKEAGKSLSRDEWELHGKTVNEGLSCLSWLTVSPPIGLPHETAESAVGGSDYWANKIRVMYKKAGPLEQLEFCDTFKALLLGLVKYIKSHHKSGLEWNPRGVDISMYEEKKGTESASSITTVQAPKKAEGGGMGALFGELNKGLAVTGGLKKVTKEQQTWRAEYKGEGETNPTIPAKKSIPKPVANKPTGTPRFEFLQMGSKWVIENQDKDAGMLQVNITDTKHSVYIYGCADAIIDISGKCKSVCIDGCKKTKVFVDECISSIEAVNCQRIQVQIRVSVPSIAIDKTDGFLCYLSKTAVGTSFTTSKSSEMNVNFPKPGTTDNELMELPLPEQFVHKLGNLEDGQTPAISSSVSDLYTH